MKKIVALFLLLSFRSIGQTDSTGSFSEDLRNKPIQSGILFEFGYQKSTFGSLGAVVGTNFGKTKEPSIGFGAVLDVFYNGTVATFGPRAILFVNVTNNVGLRFSAGNYLQENNELLDTRLFFEVGYSFAGRYGLSVGLGLPLFAKRHTEIGNFKAGISVNLAK